MGERMNRYNECRDGLRSGMLRYRHLDAAQLIKHAYGLVTEGRRARPASGVLWYIYAEPKKRGNVEIPVPAHILHRAEIADFKSRVAGDRSRVCRRQLCGVACSHEPGSR